MRSGKRRLKVSLWNEQVFQTKGGEARGKVGLQNKSPKSYDVNERRFP